MIDIVLGSGCLVRRIRNTSQLFRMKRISYLWESMVETEEWPCRCSSLNECRLENSHHRLSITRDQLNSVQRHERIVVLVPISDILLTAPIGRDRQVGGLRRGVSTEGNHMASVSLQRHYAQKCLKQANICDSGKSCGAPSRRAPNTATNV